MPQTYWLAPTRKRQIDPRAGRPHWGSTSNASPNGKKPYSPRDGPATLALICWIHCARWAVRYSPESWSQRSYHCHDSPANLASTATERIPRILRITASPYHLIVPSHLETVRSQEIPAVIEHPSRCRPTRGVTCRQTQRTRARAVVHTSRSMDQPRLCTSRKPTWST